MSDGPAQYLRNHAGFERAWLGPWDHVRGNETDETGRLLMGRKGFFDEVMRFYGRFLKRTRPKVKDPRIAVQTNDGKWRGEALGLRPTQSTTRQPAARQLPRRRRRPRHRRRRRGGVWTISPPLLYDAHLSGSGRATVDVATSLPRANLVVDVYDLDARGTGPLITRQGHLVRPSGPLALDLWSADWKIPAGHRIAVRVTDANTDWWVHVPTLATVTVEGASITLPFLAARASATIPGDPGVQLVPTTSPGA